MKRTEMRPNVGQDYLLVEHMRRVREEERILLSKNSFISIFSPFSKGKEKCDCLIDFIPCQDCADAALIKESKKAELEILLGTLTPEQYYVISRHYELDGCEKKSFESIADCLKITKKEAHKIHDDAILILRGKEYSEIIKACLC